MIVGIGVDLVDLARFERAIARTPGCSPACSPRRDVGIPQLPLRSLAARFAAKEALIKALGDSTGMRWNDMRVVSDELGNPSFGVLGAMSGHPAQRGITALHLSMSHDAGLAIAYVIAEGRRLQGTVSARPLREARVDLDAISSNVRALRGGDRHRPLYGGRQGGRIRPRSRALPPAPRCAAARTGWASSTSPRRCSCARRASARRSWPGCTARTRLRRGGGGGHRHRGEHPGATARRRRGGPGLRPAAV